MNRIAAVGRTIFQGFQMACASLNPAELAARLRYTAADLLVIASGHVEVGNIEIAAKMTVAAGELTARADALERDTDLAKARPRQSARR